MNDRDALIERVKQHADRLVVLSSPGSPAWSEGRDMQALISLASPSPAQWPEDVENALKMIEGLAEDALCASTWAFALSHIHDVKIFVDKARYALASYRGGA